MEFETYNINGLLSFVPRKFEDERGLFYESFNLRNFREMIAEDVSFVQDNVSHSKKYVVRGLHFQAPPHAQGKLVRVSQGRALDVAVDLRKESPTYGQHVSIELSAANGIVFWIPAGFAHGFVALEDGTVFNYKCTDFYHKDSEVSIRWDDPTLNIDWGIEGATLSEKDQDGLAFEGYDSPF